MKFVYVLISNENDFYAEQAMVAIYSLRKHNPAAKVTLLTDHPTLYRLKNSKSFSQSQPIEILTVDIPSEFDQQQRSRYLKTRMRKFVDGDFLYLDTDTIVTAPLNDLSLYDYEMGAVIQQDMENSETATFHPHLRMYNQQCGFNVNENYGITDFFNSGVLLCRDTPSVHKLFDRWHNLWLESSIKFNFRLDQPALWRANREIGNLMGILPGEYNLMAIKPDKACHFIMNCKIFHYFSSSKNLADLRIKQTSFLHEIREKGIDRQVDSLLENIRSEYIDLLKKMTPEEHILECNSFQQYESTFYKPSIILARKISEKIPWVDTILHKIFILFWS